MRDKGFGLLRIISIMFVVLAIGVIVCGEKAYSEKIKASCDATVVENVYDEKIDIF
ncbi:hypothetical protein IZY60_05565 [Lutibacter sp. B2]|nr:hypothetical protein [Lutibacter sp. B2]